MANTMAWKGKKKKEGPAKVKELGAGLGVGSREGGLEKTIGGLMDGYGCDNYIGITVRPASRR